MFKSMYNFYFVVIIELLYNMKFCQRLIANQEIDYWYVGMFH